MVWKEVSIFGILIICTVLISGCTANNQLNEKRLAFCNESKTQTQYVESLSTPNEYIEQSENKEFLKVWKDAFIRYNEIDEFYFNSHIRIESDQIIDVPHGSGMTYDPNPNRDKYLNIHYYFIVDWLSIPIKDGFLIKYQDSDNYRSINEIKNDIDGKIDIPGRTKTDIQFSWEAHISYIRNHQGGDLKNHGSLINVILSCENVISMLSISDQSLIPNQVGFHDRDFVIRANGNIDNKICSSASMSLINGRMLYYYPDQPCFIT